MLKRRYIIVFITVMLLSLLHSAYVLSAEYKQPASEEVTKNRKTNAQLLHEVAQLKSELKKERKLRKELQEQLNALTELEENINERETQDNSKQMQ